MFLMIPGIFKIFLILPIFLLVFAVIALIVSFVRLGSKRPWVALIAVSVLFLLFASTFLHIPRMRLFSHNSQPYNRSISFQDTKTAIWLPGIEDQFETYMHPSKLSAVRSIGLHIGRAVQKVLDAQESPGRFIVFQEAHERSLIEEFVRAVGRAFPETNCFTRTELMGLQANEVGLRLKLTDIQNHPAPWLKDSDGTVTSGRIEATALAKSKGCTIHAGFVEKPWVEDFSSFSNTKSKGRFIIARSTDSCVTEAEANRQAVENACKHITAMLEKTSRRLSKIPASYTHPVDSDDIIECDFIQDRFVQSFGGTAGRIWRQALLIDASPEKLTRLARRKAALIRASKRTWARLSISVVGLILLITVVYAFLNAATKGYYVWSLRIAGMVIFLVVIFFFLL